MSGHTPGPWFVSGPFIGPRLSPDSGILLKAARISGDETDAECIANARLIAAAPELLVALEGLLGATEEIGYVHYGPYRAAARAAIAKARGAA